MFAIDDPTVAASLPAPEAAGAPGFFTEGNPGTGVPATYLRASFLNMVQQELLNVVTDAGLTPSKSVYNQLLQALKLKYATVPQVAGVVGSMRNLRAQVTVAAASTAFTADEIVVETALGGSRYCLPSFNKTLNLAATGAGGMDIGTAPVSGWVAVYAIYNPTTGVSNVLATNSTAAVAPEVYGGANMPAGYTASALISVWPTTGASLLAIAKQLDRDVYYFKSVLSITATAGFTSLSLATAVPRNATRWRGNGVMSSSVITSLSFAVCPTVDGQAFPGYVAIQACNGAAGILVGGTIPDSPIFTPQTTFYAFSAGGGTVSLVLNSYGYSF